MCWKVERTVFVSQYSSVLNSDSDFFSVKSTLGWSVCDVERIPGCYPKMKSCMFHLFILLSLIYFHQILHQLVPQTVAPNDVYMESKCKSKVVTHRLQSSKRKSPVLVLQIKDLLGTPSGNVLYISVWLPFVLKGTSGALASLQVEKLFPFHVLANYQPMRYVRNSGF